MLVFASFVTLSCLAILANQCIAGYALEDDYSPSQFFDMFSFFTGPDPTNGFVDYVDQKTAESTGLISVGANNIYLGVDTSNITPNGRPSVRLTSNKSYNHGLIILDLEHMPVGCGTWPAFWMVGPDWPSYGEIDIIEGVNLASTNSMTLHTGPNCSITNNGKFTGSLNTHQCYVYAPGQNSNAGCSIGATSSLTYGTGFNANNGGIYATEWTADAISVWFFPRGGVPNDIANGQPNPSSWGQPVAMFQGDCDLDSMIRDQQIVFDMTFCGDWAGSVWSSSSCASQASTCNAFVQNSPSAFKNAYWSINSLRVYQNSGDSSSSSSVQYTTPTSTLAPTIVSSISQSTSVSKSKSSKTRKHPNKQKTSSAISLATAMMSASVGAADGRMNQIFPISFSASLTPAAETSPSSPLPAASTATNSANYAMFKAPFPMQGPIINTCSAFYKSSEGETCDSIAASFGNFTSGQFLIWNPSINADCTNMWASTYFCVGVDDVTSSGPSKRNIEDGREADNFPSVGNHAGHDPQRKDHSIKDSFVGSHAEYRARQRTVPESARLVGSHEEYRARHDAEHAATPAVGSSVEYRVRRDMEDSMRHSESSLVNNSGEDHAWDDLADTVASALGSRLEYYAQQDAEDSASTSRISVVGNRMEHHAQQYAEDSAASLVNPPVGNRFHYHAQQDAEDSAASLTNALVGSSFEYHARRDTEDVATPFANGLVSSSFEYFAQRDVENSAESYTHIVVLGNRAESRTQWDDEELSHLNADAVRKGKSQFPGDIKAKEATQALEAEMALESELAQGVRRARFRRGMELKGPQGVGHKHHNRRSHGHAYAH